MVGVRLVWRWIWFLRIVLNLRMVVDSLERRVGEYQV